MSSHRLAFIDSLRGLAACYVVLYHLALLPTPSLIPPEFLRSFILYGGSGVALFFVLSAYTMCLTMHNRMHEDNAVSAFYWRRFFRIAPLFYVLLLVKLVFDKVVLQQNHSVTEIMASVGFAFNLIPSYVSGIVMASWTIGVEMLFYLIFPYLFKIVYTLPRAIGLLLFSLVIDSLVQTVLAKYLPDSTQSKTYLHMNIAHQIPVFALGFIAYFFHCHIDRYAALKRNLGYELLTISSLLFYLVLQDLQVPSVSNWHFIALIYTLFILGVAFVQPKILVNKATQFLGEISYSIYLNHALLIVVLIILSGPFSLPFSSSWFYIAALIVVFSLLLPLSVATFRLVEQPAINFGRQIFRNKNA